MADEVEVEAGSATEPEEQDERLGEAGLRALQREREQRRALEQQLKSLEPLAARARELEDAQKTEQQRLEERAAAAERERDETRQELTRLRMAARYGLAEDDIDLLGVGSDEEIEARAKRLADRLSATPPVTPGRPVDASRLRSAAADADAPPADGNDWLRAMVRSKQSK